MYGRRKTDTDIASETGLEIGGETSRETVRGSGRQTQRHAGIWVLIGPRDRLGHRSRDRQEALFGRQDSRRAGRQVRDRHEKRKGNRQG